MLSYCVFSHKRANIKVELCSTILVNVKYTNTCITREIFDRDFIEICLTSNLE